MVTELRPPENSVVTGPAALAFAMSGSASDDSDPVEFCRVGGSRRRTPRLLPERNVTLQLKARRTVEEEQLQRRGNAVLKARKQVSVRSERGGAAAQSSAVAERPERRFRNHVARQHISREGIHFETCCAAC